jgi:hypothetical protein
MTLNLARNFLLLPFAHRASILMKLKVLNTDELFRLSKCSHGDAIETYKTAFYRIKERNQIKALEQIVKDYFKS